MRSTSEYSFHPLVITRTPFYKSGTYYRPLAAIIRDPHFVTAVLLSSKSLYQAIEKKDFLYERFSEKERLSLKQYFNRMCFRPTPFGLSAGISVSWNENQRESGFIEPDRVITMIDFEHSVLIAEQAINHQTAYPLKYSLNPSLYKVNNAYRYIRFVQNNDGERTFLIESIELSDALADVLSYFKQTRTLDEISHFLIHEYDITRENSMAFSKELIERQVILSGLMPNITGPDYYERVMEKLDANGFLGGKKSGDRNVFSTNYRSLDDFANSFAEVENDVRVLSGSEGSMKSSLYVNLERNRLSGSSGEISPELQKQLLRGLSCLEKLVPDDQNEQLIRFKEDFKRKFELKWMPLLTALDPEVGVGYGSLGKQAEECDLTGDLQISNLHKDTRSIQWSHRQTFLMNKWNASMRKNSGIPTIELKEEELQDLEQQGNTSNLPPSIALLFRKMGKYIYIEEAGGASALSIVGRFTAFNDPVRAAAEHLAEIEQSANPDILFAEIAHFSSFRTANINRRAAVRPYEIPVVTGAGVDPEHQVALNDLWVSVVDDEIILWSKKLRKRIIPRLSSAYNFSRSDLAVFRFLCDLQFQKIRSNFSLDLYPLFPDLSFYPRVQYKDTVLHLASWHINEKTVNSVLVSTDLSSQLTGLKTLCYTLGWPRYISVCRQDNYITIDTSDEEELIFLLRLFKKNSSLIIKEFPFIDVENRSCNKNNEDSYITQYTALLYHKQKIYDQVNPPFNSFFSTKVVQRKFLPGSDWNYFKVYCHSARANEILIRHIVPLCERWMGAGFLDKWFFIRYKDPEYHLRIRLHSDPVNTGMLIRGINTLLTPLIESRIISNVQTGVYEREIERYGADIIEFLERSFSSGTALITGFLAKNSAGSPVDSLFQMAYCSISIILDSFNYNLDNRISLFERFYHNMKPEFGIARGENDQLKRKFRTLKSSNHFLPVHQIVAKYKLDKEASYFQYTHKEVFRLLAHSAPERKDCLAGDIIHMHLNRLFASSPRKNEWVIYYCLWKYYASEAGRQRALLSRLLVDQF